MHSMKCQLTAKHFNCKQTITAVGLSVYAYSWLVKQIKYVLKFT